ncbi:MAG TPA: tRNA preQ1(34) S-adenosylmethionine ribosyltransferase-isomerase QueA [Acetobacteraceae bacterium]|nr:tRNA preQ1(34) S-adenosylmethionine ribosyltransferase-isomerase QueA [Acetobacteraceae bacterium]
MFQCAATGPLFRLSDYDFELPADRIAQHPARPRDSARLLAVGEILQDRIVHDLPDLLRPGDVVVVNDTRVIPAQLYARRGDARIGITLDRPLADGTWHALARNARRLHPGDMVRFDGAPELAAEVRARDADGGVTLAFNLSGAAFAAALAQGGALALPPYIERPTGPLAEDTRDYQTIFARREGAVAAPTAGLHFTPALLEAMERRGVRCVTVTLHVGAGTFLPVRTDDITAHRMHPERCEIGPAAAAAINAARHSGSDVVAIGTTSLRLLESAAAPDGTIHPFAGDTDLFIVPGYRFRAVDRLLTNFHLPRSTLFMLVCAFAGYERMRAAYMHAIATGYRFYSYGDACLLSGASTCPPE